MPAGLTAANGKCRFAEIHRERLSQHRWQWVAEGRVSSCTSTVKYCKSTFELAFPIGVVSWLVHPPIASRFGLTLFRSKFWAPTLPSTLLREVLFCPCLRYFAYISSRVWEMLSVIEKSGLCCCSDRTTAVYRCFCWTNDSELIHGHQKRCESEREWIKEKRQWRNCLFEDELQFWSFAKVL